MKILFQIENRSDISVLCASPNSKPGGSSIFLLQCVKEDLSIEIEVKEGRV